MIINTKYSSQSLTTRGVFSLGDKSSRAVLSSSMCPPSSPWLLVRTNNLDVDWLVLGSNKLVVLGLLITRVAIS